VPTFSEQTGDPAEQLAAIIRDLRDRVRALEERGHRIPVLDADPATSDPTNLWFLEDGRLRGRTADGLLHEFAEVTAARPPVPTFASDPAESTGWRVWFNGGAGELRGRLANGTVVRFPPVTAGSSGDGGTGSSGGSTSTKPKPSDTSPKPFTKTYPATWGRTLCPTHGVETGGRYGTFPGSSHGLRRVMLGFDDAAIRADLAGATIREAELRMRNTDAWAYSGIDVHFGAHNQSSPPSAYSAVRKSVFKDHWPHTGEGKTWRSMSTWVGRSLRDNTIKGLTIEQPSSSAAYYGAMEWGSVQLRIHGTK
jgi:hypothetical protein